MGGLWREIYPHPQNQIHWSWYKKRNIPCATWRASLWEETGYFSTTTLPCTFGNRPLTSIRISSGALPQWHACMVFWGFIFMQIWWHKQSSFLFPYIYWDYLNIILYKEWCASLWLLGKTKIFWFTDFEWELFLYLLREQWNIATLLGKWTQQCSLWCTLWASQWCPT